MLGFLGFPDIHPQLTHQKWQKKTKKKWHPKSSKSNGWRVEKWRNYKKWHKNVQKVTIFWNIFQKVGFKLCKIAHRKALRVNWMVECDRNISLWWPRGINEAEGLAGSPLSLINPSRITKGDISFNSSHSMPTQVFLGAIKNN